jgi:hypothetical protein
MTRGMATGAGYAVLVSVNLAARAQQPAFS